MFALCLHFSILKPGYWCQCFSNLCVLIFECWSDSTFRSSLHHSYHRHGPVCRGYALLNLMLGLSGHGMFWIAHNACCVQSAELDTHMKAAVRMDFLSDVQFAHTTNKNIASHYGITQLPAVELLRNFDTGRKAYGAPFWWSFLCPACWGGICSRMHFSDALCLCGRKIPSDSMDYACALIWNTIDTELIMLSSAQLASVTFQSWTVSKVVIVIRTQSPQESCLSWIPCTADCSYMYQLGVQFWQTVLIKSWWLLLQNGSCWFLVCAVPYGFVCRPRGGHEECQRADTVCWRIPSPTGHTFQRGKRWENLQ